MLTVGLYSDPDECAVAVAAEGRIVGAVQRPHAMGNVRADGLEATLEAALVVAGVGKGDLEAATIVDTGSHRLADDEVHRLLSGCRIQSAPSRYARAAQLRGCTGSGIVLSLDDDASADAHLFVKQGGLLNEEHSARQATAVLRIASEAARVLGCAGPQPLDFLERIARSRLGPRQWPTGSITSEVERTAKTFESWLSQQSESELSVPVERTPSGLAQAALSTLCLALAHDARAMSAGDESFRGFVGTAARIPTVVNCLNELLPGCHVAAVPDAVGATLGAALLPFGDVGPLHDLALGQAHTEQEIKNTLENCRLEYVYEPEWSRLFTRVSSLLSSGALVGWFQGPRDFGKRSFGSRSILCDPSLRYSRENVNVYLLRRDVDAPLSAIALSDESVAGHATVSSPGAGRREHQPLMTRRVVDSSAPSRLFQLLETHRRQAGMSELINVPLTGQHGIVQDAREAIASTFSSAVDVLVIGRFLVSKDYWRLRSV
jgi:hypothetical protein